MRIVAFDLSLAAVGWCTADAFMEQGTLRTKLVDIARLDWLRSAVSDMARSADLVLIEDFSFGSKGRAVYQIGGLQFMVRHYLWKSGIPYCLVAPSQLKKFATGKGNADKSIVIREVFARWGVSIDDDNAADAYVLAMIGRGLVGEWQPTTKPQMEVLAEVRRRNAAELEKVGAAA